MQWRLDKSNAQLPQVDCDGKNQNFPCFAAVCLFPNKEAPQSFPNFVPAYESTQTGCESRTDWVRDVREYETTYNATRVSCDSRAKPLTRNKNYTRYMTVFFNACGNCKIILKTVIQNTQYTKEIRFFVTSRAWNKKKSELPKAIEKQTIIFRALLFQIHYLHCTLTLQNWILFNYLLHLCKDLQWLVKYPCFLPS